MVTAEMVEAARTEFWRVLAIKELTLEDAWKAALEAAEQVRQKTRGTMPTNDDVFRMIERANQATPNE
jgi:hypothetical protein